MILSDVAIRDRINKQTVSTEKLLQDYEDNNIRYCGYELRLGKVVAPQTGEITPSDHRPGATGQALVLKPSEMALVITKEMVHLPTDLCATYGQLNRLANKGLMILNTSIVEPGYFGPLSCVLVNFSSEKQALSLGEPIAKLNFQQVEGIPKETQKAIARDQYEATASKNGTALPKSLLDISGIEERVKDKVGSSVKTSVAFAGVLIAVLLLWSQIEGVVSKWTGATQAQRQTQAQTDLALKQMQLENQKATLELQSKIGQLENEVKRLGK